MLINQWPTRYTVVTNRFGADPAYYQRFNLPGHEGVDFRVLYRAFVSPIYSCTDGTVKFIGYRSQSDPYGYQIRIITQYEGDQYELVYAHLTNGSCLVHVGQAVHPGTVLGQGGATGNTRGAHLHLSLIKKNATALKQTSYPFDLVNPEPHLKEYIAAMGLEVEWK
jgi:murein DD-endopeptidase MepM/ murein hydrolase activator NlpD